MILDIVPEEEKKNKSEKKQMQSAPTPGVLDEIQMDNKKNGKRQKP